MQLAAISVWKVKVDIFWRKIQALGLGTDLYKNDPVTQRFIHKAAALVFVPLAFVRVAWTRIEADTPGIPETDNMVVWPLCTKNLELYHQHKGLRTNNHLEGWHNHLKRAARKAHPNLYEFIEIIQKEQAVTEVTIQQLEEEGRLRAKRRKAVQHEENIKRLTDDFVVGNRTLESFLSSISFCVGSFYYWALLFLFMHTFYMHTALHHLLLILILTLVVNLL